MEKCELYEERYQNKKSFSFGKNWLAFLQKLDDARIEKAKKSLIDFLGGEYVLRDKRFVDIGCGSGLFSLSAFLLGAKSVVSVDVDTSSVEGTRYLKHTFGNDSDSWKVVHGSILDQALVQGLGTFDIVYSWGVLHHTGDMWTAIKNSVSLVKPEGLFYLAIYNERVGFQSSRFWWCVKSLYNRSNVVIKKIIELLFIIQFFAMGLIRFENRFLYIKNYRSRRGMSWYTDVVDWLGGYPYEYCTVRTMKDFFDKRGFSLLNVKDCGDGTGCNEFLFKRGV